MPLYRVQVELRRAHSEDGWGMAGVVIDGRWRPLRTGTEPPSIRAVEAGLVDLRALPPVIASDVTAATAVARWVAMNSGDVLWAAPGRAGARSRRASCHVPLRTDTGASARPAR